MRQELVKQIRFFDERRSIAAPGNYENTLHYCLEHFVDIANQAIADHGYFAVALSGGSTPKAIYEGLSDKSYRQQIDWTRVHLYWSDERCAPPYDPESNFRMAMDAGLSKLHIAPENIHRMQAEGDVEEGALAYEHLVTSKIPGHSLDLVMLGMGDDGHTASLFPKTHGLHSGERLIVANYIPQKDVWRMTMTFKCIHAAKNSVIYIMGKSKASMLNKVLTGPHVPDELPVQRVGTPEHPALWIADDEALSLLHLA